MRRDQSRMSSLAPRQALAVGHISGEIFMIPRLCGRLRLAVWRIGLEVVERTGKGNDEVKSDKPEEISVSCE